MTFLINGIIICVILLALIVWCVYQLRRLNAYAVPATTLPQLEREKYSLQVMIKYIKDQFNELTGANLYDLALDLEDFNRHKQMRTELKAALKGCNSGDLYDKLYIKELIFDLLIRDYGLNEHNVDQIIPFGEPAQLTVQDQFDILLQLYKQKYQYKALSRMIDEYRLDDLKQVIEHGDTESYIITAEEIRHIYRQKVRGSLSFEDKLQIITQRIYQSFKGFGVIDEIRNMDIDGISGECQVFLRL